jgi:hypothetical protein
MKTKNWKLFVGVSSALVVAVSALQGCSSDEVISDIPGAGDAGAAGDTSTPTAGTGGASAGAAGVTGDAGDDGMSVAGAAGGSSEPLTQAELCEKFCTDEFVTCTGDLQQYDTLEDCAAACNQFARGTEGDTAGNTLDCRIYHLNAAATVDAMVHCPHTGATPTAACVDN